MIHHTSWNPEDHPPPPVCAACRRPMFSGILPTPPGAICAECRQHPGGPAGAALAALRGDHCSCRRCLREEDARDATNWPILMGYMIVCLTCGDKRCPKAEDHREPCAGS